VKAAFRALLACLLLCGSVSMAKAATNKTQTVKYQSGNETVTGFLALPGTPGRHPAVIVIHEWWGLVDWVKQQAENLSAHGYVALAVDLYRGRSSMDPMEAHELMRGLPPDRGLRDLEAAFKYLASRPDVNPAKIGSIGWCMGGGWSIQLAETEPRLAACVVNYGALPTSAEIIEKIKAPVLGNFGGQDRGITPDSVQAFAKAMRADHKVINVKVYPDAGHAFENPNNKGGYRPEDARDAWERSLNFLNHYLK
jgi:carboxymethylenebutenolidase